MGSGIVKVRVWKYYESPHQLTLIKRKIILGGPDLVRQTLKRVLKQQQKLAY